MKAGTIAVAAFFFFSCFSLSGADYTYELADIRVHKGPLPFHAQSGQMLDWTEAPDKTGDVDRWSDESPKRKEDKGVKYEHKGPQAVAWWTRPHYIESQRLITMEIYVAALGGGGGVYRIECYSGFGYKARKSDPLGRKAAQLARAMLSEKVKSAAQTATLKVGEQGLWPEKIDFFVRVSNGSMVSADVMAYTFRRKKK